jgi:uncharacterized protein
MMVAMDMLAQIIGDYKSFLRIVLEDMAGAGFDMGDFVQIDHMCYRTVSEENYEAKKRELAGVADLLAEPMVSARPIAVFRLRVPVRFDGWRVDTVEVPAPKPSKPFAEGLEHVELVLFDDKDAFLAKYAGKNFDLVSADRGINPEIGLKLEHCAVKFHLLNLPTVVYLEKKLGLGVN